MFDALLDQITKLKSAVAGKPDFRWGVVSGVTPLQVTLDADPAPLAGVPSTLVAGLVVGQRVQCVIQNHRVTVVGASGGVQDLRGTTAQRLALEAASAVVDGMRFYDTEDNFEYMWVGEWRIVGGVSPFTSLTVNSGSGMCQWRRVGELIHFQFDVTRSSSMAGDVMWDPLCTLPPEARPATTIAISAWGGSVRLASSAVRADGTVIWRQQSSTSTNHAVGEGLWPSI